MSQTQAAPLLEVTNLTKHFPVTAGFLVTREIGRVRAVDDVSFHIGRGETLGLVGESGCGKSTTGRLVLRLIEPTSGAVRIDGRDVLSLDAQAMREMRKGMQIVFQDPYSSLNPRMTVEEIILEPLYVQGAKPGPDMTKRARKLLDTVGLSPNHVVRYPHEFSGGQRQRIGIARALAPQPRFIVCDEAVSALDVSVQAQIVNLLRDLKQERGIAMLVIAHDLALVHQLSDRVAVLYLGRVVEEGPADGLVARPLHPYTAALLSASPQPDPRAASRRIVLKGEPPSALDRPSGCAFHPRCPIARPACAVTAPPLAAAGDRRSVACFFPGELPGPLMGA
jgi:oligopeptide/dipeptide ABC transporter ATP-binding protein